MTMASIGEAAGVKEDKVRRVDEPSASDPRVELADRDHQGHVAAAAASCALLWSLPVATAFVSVTYLVLALISIIRAKKVWSTIRPFRRQAIPWLIAAWIVWTGASIAWSPDASQGWDELRSFRMALIPLLLWPVLVHPRLLLGTMLAGIAVQQLMQVFQGLEWFGLDTAKTMGRLGGLNHPITTGLWSAVGATFWLAFVLCLKDRRRWLGLIPLAACGLSLLATESRGPWLASAVVLPMMAVVLMIARREARLPGLEIIVLGAIGAGVVWMAAGDALRERVDSAVSEFNAAMEHEQYSTSVGLRVGQTRWCLELIEQAPVLGHGAGAFGEAQQELEAYQRAIQGQTEDQVDYMTRDQPHSTPLHIVVTTGAVGGMMMLGIIVLGVWRSAKLALGRNRWPAAEPLMAAVPFAILLWVIGSCFDSYHLSGDRAGLLFVLIALAAACPVTDQDDGDARMASSA